MCNVRFTCHVDNDYTFLMAFKRKHCILGKIIKNCELPNHLFRFINIDVITLQKVGPISKTTTFRHFFHVFKPIKQKWEEYLPPLLLNGIASGFAKIPSAQSLLHYLQFVENFVMIVLKMRQKNVFFHKNVKICSWQVSILMIFCQ